MPKAKLFNTPASVEAATRIADGCTAVTLKQLDERLRAIGYRLDRASRCAGISRYMSGPHTGRTYPNVNYGVCQIDNGMPAFHVEARRDENFKTMQSLRDELFVLARGAIHGI